MGKNERISQLEYLLLQQTRGLKRSEIARRLGVHRATISRDICSLSRSLPIIEEDDGRLRIDKKGYLTNVSLSMLELEALHLSARLFFKVMKFPFPHAAGALRKLSEAQGRVSIALSERIRETAEEIEISTSSFTKTHDRYREIIEKLGIAISEFRPVEVTHFSSRKKQDQTFFLLPVTLEPHPEGKAVHLAGWDYLADPAFFRILKIERIKSLELHDSAPSLFKKIPIDSLKKKFVFAWSIWTNEREPETVVLRFSKGVAYRVAETQWHISQELREEKNGSMVMTCRIAEPKEMYPWIRSWGPDVEVLKPDWLRVRHHQDFLNGIEMYDSTCK